MNTALEKLFGSSARVKMIRLFLSNSENLFSLEDVSRRAKVPTPVAKRELSFQGDRADKTKRPDNRRTLPVAGEPVKLKNGTIKTKKEKI